MDLVSLSDIYLALYDSELVCNISVLLCDFCVVVSALGHIWLGSINMCQRGMCFKHIFKSVALPLLFFV